MKLRPANIDDLPAITALFKETINSVCSDDYTEKQLLVWCQGAENTERWVNRIREQHFLVAEEKGEVAGFGSISEDGYLDLLYVHKDHQRKGIAGMLMDAMLDFARSQGVTVVISDVSITAKSTECLSYVALV
ncbi:MAG: GNAT family N-acetyltransferase [Balneolaceae bacterium]|nr:GNAT family N-acetyltransferase [Balneolaceae bacterium]